MSDFTNKVVVITGGNSGIGLATAKELRRRGAKVVISGRDEKTLAEAAAAIGRDTLAVHADVSRLGDLDKLFARTKERFGSIDVLFVNAGVARFAPFEQITEAIHDEIMGINFKGAFCHRLLQALSPAFDSLLVARPLGEEPARDQTHTAVLRAINTLVRLASHDPARHFIGKALDRDAGSHRAQLAMTGRFAVGSFLLHVQRPALEVGTAGPHAGPAVALDHERQERRLPLHPLQPTTDLVPSHAFLIAALEPVPGVGEEDFQAVSGLDRTGFKPCKKSRQQVLIGPARFMEA